MEIKDIQGNVIVDVPITQSAVKTEELMKQYSIALSWNAISDDELPLGSYIEYEGVRYSLLEPYSPEQRDEATFEYRPVFQHPIMRLSKALFFFYTYSDGAIVSKELDWSLTDNPANFMSAICDALLNELGESWTYEIASDLPASTSLSFSNTDMFSALNSIAGAFETEWWFDYTNKVLYLSKAQHGEAVTLEVGQNIGVSQVTPSKEGYYTRFYVFGSTRNIDQSYAGANVNSIVNRRLTLDPAKYPNGYIDIREGLTQEEILPTALVFDNIYPRSYLTISDVKVRLMWRLDDNGKKVPIGTDSEGNEVYDQYAIWYFKIPELTFSKDMLISGKALSVHFNSGPLQGREFELTYHDKTEELSNTDGSDFIVEAGDYEINFIEEGTFIIPAITGLIPIDGNSVTLFNIIMPEEYKSGAYEELEAEALKAIAKKTEDNSNYTFDSNKAAFYENNPNLTIGRVVTFVNGTRSISTRVIKLETQLDYPFEQRITVGNAQIKGTQQTLKEEVVSANQNIDLLAAINESTEAFQQALQRTQKLMQENMAADLFERVNVGTEEEPVYSVIPKPYKGQPVGICSDTFITAGGRNGNSSDQGSATTLGGLANVDDTADNVLTEDVVLFKGINATHWTLRALSTLGINEEKLQTYLETNKYVTQTFLTDNKYLIKQAADELYMPISEILWERVNVGTEDNPQWAVIPVDFNGNPVGIVSDTFITSGGRKGSSSGTGSSFNRLDSWDNYNPNAGDVLSAVLGYELKTRLDNLNVGLDETKLKEYLDTNEYITKTAGNELYAPLASFSELNTKFNDFLTGSDTNNIIDKWKELEAFLAGQTETSTLADLLIEKADKTALEAVTTRVTTVEGYFNNGAAKNALKLGGQLPEYYATASALSTHISTYNAFVNNTYAAHITTYNNHISAYNTHITEFNNHVSAFNSYKATTDARLDALEALWAIDEENNGLYPKSGRGIWSESYITAGGIGTSAGAGGLIQNVYGYGDLGGTFSNNNLTDTFNAYTINTLATRIGNLESGASGAFNSSKMWELLGAGTTEQINASHIPDLSGKYLSLSGGTIEGSLNFKAGLSITSAGNSVLDMYSGVDTYLRGSSHIYLSTPSLLYLNSSGTSYTLIHSGNIISYNAGSATKLQDNTAYTAWGQTFFEGGVPKNVNGAITINGSGHSTFNTRIDSNYFYIGLDSNGYKTPFAIGWRNHTDLAIVINNNDNVGIGTTSPAYKLDVNGTLNATTIYQNGTAIGSLAFKNTLVASDIPSLDWSKITTGKPTTLAGYGITDTYTASTIAALFAGYLPLSGGIIKNGSVRNPLSIDTTDSEGAYLVMKANGENRAYFGYDSSLGALIQDISITYGSTLLYIRDGAGYIGNINKWNTLIHSGNIISYNAGSATKLQTARTIWGQSFDGTANVTGDPVYINNTALYFKDTAGNNINGVYFNANNVLILGSGCSSRGYGTVIRAGEFEIQYGVSYTTGFAMKNNGNVLIGTTTDVSNYKIGVNGGGIFNSSIRTHSLKLGESAVSSFGWNSDWYYAKIGLVYEESSPSYLNPAITFSTMYNSYSPGSEVERMRICSNGNVSIGYAGNAGSKLYVAGNIVATGAVTAGSDARYKTRLQDVAVDIETIANAPLFTFKWNDREDDRIHLGTTAQYWAQTNFKNAVIPTTDEKLWTMSYSQIAMGNTIVLARELLPIKRKVSEIDNLKNRLHKAERKIEILEQELNQYRRA